MVGVPGRSKACHTCRQRRMKCGEERPRCNNCVKSKRLCTGYQRKYAFVLSKDMRIVEPAGPFEETDLAPVLVSRWRIKHGASPSSHSLPSQKSTSTLPATPIQTHTEPSLVRQGITHRHAFRDQLLGLFIQGHLPKDARELESRNFLLRLPDLPNVSPALESALLAVCTARLGRQNGQEDLTARSLTLYTESLRELQRSILNPVTRCHDHTLAACLALTLYEFTECPGKEVNGYHAHVTGALNLLRLRGADAHTSSLGHSVFSSLRMHAVVQGLMLRTRSFLSHHEWQSLPFASTQKGHYDLLLDQLLDLPELFARTDISDRELSPQAKLIQLLTTAQFAWRANCNLAAWFACFQSSVGGPLYWPRLATITTAADSKEKGNLFPVAFHFPVFIVAQTLMMFWVAQIIVQTHLRKIYGGLAELLETAETGEAHCFPYDADPSGSTKEKDLEGTGQDKHDATVIIDAGEAGSAKIQTCLRHFSMDGLPPLGHQLQPEDAVRRICQSVEYFLQEDMGTFGSSTAVPSLVIARAYMPTFSGDWNREVMWANEMLKRVYMRGSKIAGHV